MSKSNIKAVARITLDIPKGWELKDTKVSKITFSHDVEGEWGALIRRESFPQKFEHDIVVAPCFVGDSFKLKQFNLVVKNISIEKEDVDNNDGRQAGYQWKIEFEVFKDETQE